MPGLRPHPKHASGMRCSYVEEHSCICICVSLHKPTRIQYTYIQLPAHVFVYNTYIYVVYTFTSCIHVCLHIYICVFLLIPTMILILILKFFIAVLLFVCFLGCCLESRCFSDC